MIVINPGRDLYPETALTRRSSPQKTCQTTSLETPVSTLCSNWIQLSRADHSSGTTAGVYALPAVQSKLRELRRGLAPPALCYRVRNRNTHRVRNRKTPRSFQSRNSPEVSVFCSVAKSGCDLATGCIVRHVTADWYGRLPLFQVLLDDVAERFFVYD